MHSAKRFIVGLIFTAVVAAVAFGAVSVRAQSAALSDAQLATIRTNCQGVKNTLQQLHASDALLRVNRGQVYESLLTRLMGTFNTRLSNNRLDNKATVAVAGNYQLALDTFRVDYKAYEEKLAATLKMDCQKDPAGFHYALEDARTKRKTVHDDVLKLHRSIDDFRSSVGDFLLNYERDNR